MHGLDRRRAIPIALCVLLLAACASGGSPSTGPSGAASAMAGGQTPAPSADATPGATPSGVAGSTDPESPAPSPSALNSDPLHAIALVDVRSGEEFTLGELAAQKPVLLEMMAIWCTNCRAQMHRVVEAHASGEVDFYSVGIDVDPSEQPGDLRAYAAREGFDWPFAMADRQVADLLREQFGNAFFFPPNTPMVVLTPDGAIRPLEFGGYSVDELLAELRA